MLKNTLLCYMVKQNVIWNEKNIFMIEIKSKKDKLKIGRRPIRANNFPILKTSQIFFTNLLVCMHCSRSIIYLMLLHHPYILCPNIAPVGQFQLHLYDNKKLGPVAVLSHLLPLWGVWKFVIISF